jgi:transcriptional regulator
MSREKKSDDAEENNRLLQGTLDLLVLKSLSRNGVMHGFGIARFIQQVSKEALRVEEGSLYPALHRMEQEGWVRADWGKTEKNREARFYSLTARGKQQLAQEEENWARLTEGVARVISYVSV